MENSYVNSCDYESDLLLIFWNMEKDIELRKRKKNTNNNKNTNMREKGKEIK